MTVPTPPADGARWAILGDERADAALRSHADLSNAASVAWFRLRDADELAEAVREGAIDAVLVRGIDELVCGMLDGLIDLQEWRRCGVRIRIAGHDVDSAEEPLLAAISATAARWHATQRRRRAVAGCILSVIALAAAAAIALLPR